MKFTIELDSENPEHQPILLMLVTGAKGMAPVEEEPSKPASTGSTRQRKNVERQDPPPAEEPPAEEPEAPAADPLDDDMGLDDEPEAPAEEKFTEDQVRKALKNYRDINGSDATMKALKDHGGGATGMGSLKPEFYGAVMKAIR